MVAAVRAAAAARGAKPWLVIAQYKVNTELFKPGVFVKIAFILAFVFTEGMLLAFAGLV